MVERLRFSMAKSVSTNEAKDTCEAAAAAPTGQERPTSQPISTAYVVTAPPEVAGQWRLVNNSGGKQGDLLQSNSHQ
jgi:hypothetical protein